MYNNNNNYNKRIFLATFISTILIVSWTKFYASKTIKIKKDIPQKEITNNNNIEINNKSLNNESKQEITIQEDNENHIEKKN